VILLYRLQHPYLTHNAVSNASPSIRRILGIAFISQVCRTYDYMDSLMNSISRLLMGTIPTRSDLTFCARCLIASSRFGTWVGQSCDVMHPTITGAPLAVAP
jgi:hypothetical protein